MPVGTDSSGTGGIMLKRSTLHGCETEIVLLNERWIQTVDVHEQDERVIQALLGLEHQTSSVLGSLSALARTTLLLFQRYELQLMKLVWEQILGALSPVSAKRVRPNVSGNASQLLCQWQNLQLEHETLHQLSIVQGYAWSTEQ